MICEKYDRYNFYVSDCAREGVHVTCIDLDNLNEEGVYEAFDVDGNESEALNDSYLELYELIGRDAMLKLFKYFRGDKIDCPMRLYRPEYIADLVNQTTERRERAKIARAGGYTIKFIESLLTKRRKAAKEGSHK